MSIKSANNWLFILWSQTIDQPKFANDKNDCILTLKDKV